MESRLISYLYYFNVVGDYFECHEYGESLWLDSGRPVILKGLIQSAVCLYHLHNGNVKGGYAMWQRAKQYINDERPVYQGIDLDTLIRAIDEVFAEVPTAWYGKVLPSQNIASLHLPTVQIHIMDEEVLNLLPNWVPEPLDEH